MTEGVSKHTLRIGGIIMLQIMPNYPAFCFQVLSTSTKLLSTPKKRLLPGQGLLASSAGQPNPIIYNDINPTLWIVKFENNFY